MENLIEIKNLYKTYQTKGGFLTPQTKPTHAIRGVSLDIKKGEILGLVGESGCGKSTLGNCVLKLLDITKGKIFYKGLDISKLDKKELKKFRESAQMIFQNPYSSLNPKMKIKEILLEPLIVNGVKNKKRKKMLLKNVLRHVGLSDDDVQRYPHEFSGGQRQRIAIARALILNPEFIVADEPISALDVSIQAQIINLLIELKKKMNLTYLFISHDLNVVKYLCSRVAIMYLGEIVEIGLVEEIFEHPKHPYTKLLLSSIPNIENDKQIIIESKGEVSYTQESSCMFYDRCTLKNEECKNCSDEYVEFSPTHKVKCSLYKNDLKNNFI